MAVDQDPLFLEAAEALKNPQSIWSVTLEKWQERMKAWKINYVLQAKITQEQELKAELDANLANLIKTSDDLDKICASFSSGVTISDSDKLRLENAKHMQEISKKLTGIRFDFSAPPTVVKGYIKYERDRSLTPFEIPAGPDASEQLWMLLETVTNNKENKRHN